MNPPSDSLSVSVLKIAHRNMADLIVMNPGATAKDCIMFLSKLIKRLEEDEKK